MLLGRCPIRLSCLSVCDVDILWPNGWMDQGATWYGSRPRPWRHRVRWGPSSPQKGSTAAPHFSANVLWANDWMDQDDTWYGGWPWPRPHCVRWAPISPCSKKGHSSLPQFSGHVCSDQTAGWIKMPLGMQLGLSPGHIVLGEDPAPQKSTAPSNFRPMSVVAKRLDGSKCY